jgi:hypothetical protein
MDVAIVTSHVQDRALVSAVPTQANILPAIYLLPAAMLRLGSCY